MYCTNCGRKREKNEKYCPNCGRYYEEIGVGGNEFRIKDKGNLSLIFGIVSCFCLIFSGLTIFGIIFAILGIIWGRKHQKETGVKNAGVFLSAISLVIICFRVLAFLVLNFFLFSASDNEFWNNYYEEYYYDDFYDYGNDDGNYDYFSLSGYVWVGDDDSCFYLNNDMSFTWYQDDSIQDDNYYVGLYTYYVGSEAIEYIAKNLGASGLTEEYQRELIERNGSNLNEYYLLILKYTKAVIDGSEVEVGDSSISYFYGFFDDEKMYLQLTNISTFKSGGFTLKEKISKIDI